MKNVNFLVGSMWPGLKLGVVSDKLWPPIPGWSSIISAGSIFSGTLESRRSEELLQAYIGQMFLRLE